MVDFHLGQSPSHLAHEAGDDTMEGGPFEAKATLPGAQLPEVLCKDNRPDVSTKNHTRRNRTTIQSGYKYL